MLESIQWRVATVTVRLALAAIFFVAGGAGVGGGLKAAADSADQDTDFFERHIRPLLADRCYGCHSAEAQDLKSELRLDSRHGLRTGGTRGPALLPGNPEESLLLQAVRYTHPELQMPPDNKQLSEQEIRRLEEWIAMGAPDPRDGQIPAPPTDEAKHWAFQPIRPQPIPAVSDPSWVKTPVDAFILARLDDAGMKPARRADRLTLVRRAYYDLTGLPPSREEAEAFVEDPSPNAYANLVERLLASPRYGERWARYWLDLARYADTKGYVFEEERRFGHAYTYRDYVIRAFNEDKPFDRFIVEQLAADHLDLEGDKRELAAMGFLTLGRRFLNNQHDIIDDRIDVVTRGLMGLTVSCARCHDHKYDPVPIDDYYSLYGVFASGYEPDEKPLIGDPDDPQAFHAYQEEKARRQKELDEFRSEKTAEALKEVRLKTGDYLQIVHQAMGRKDADVEKLAREAKLDPNVARRWIEQMQRWKETGGGVFELFFQYQKHFSEQTPAPDISAIESPPLQEAFQTAPASMEEVAARYGELFAAAEKQHESDRPDGNKGLQPFHNLLHGEQSPIQLNDGQIMRLFDVPTAQKVRRLRRQVDELEAIHPGAPPRAMVLLDRDQPHQPKIFQRGNPNNPGHEVPRRFLKLLEGEERQPFSDGSGRLALAQKIAAADNPLTARVAVNRVWMHHFMAGLVRTPSDFGLRADPPTHPELLDWLADYFIREGWSMKKLHRLIMLSNAYQQSSDDNPEYFALDSDNSLVWRMNRRRLDLEAMRDTLLEVSGSLQLAAGGQSVDIVSRDYSNRRTIYGFVDRQNLPSLFRTFDFAMPDSHSPHRFTTSVPQQALYLMNSPFVIDQARALLQRPELTTKTGPERVEALYELVYQRRPEPAEQDQALQFVAEQSQLAPLEPPAPLWHYGYGTLDAATGQVQFTPLPHFTGQAYQGGPSLPDEKLGWTMLNKEGGHPGGRDGHAVIRRWTAPADGTYSVAGTLAHSNQEGDGVRGWIVRQDQALGPFAVHNEEAATVADPVSLKQGDVIDLVVDRSGSIEFDSFRWTAAIQQHEAGSSTRPSKDLAQWRSAAGFAGPPAASEPLSSWEKLAQVLLISNEAMFVD